MSIRSLPVSISERIIDPVGWRVDDLCVHVDSDDVRANPSLIPSILESVE